MVLSNFCLVAVALIAPPAAMAAQPKAAAAESLAVPGRTLTVLPSGAMVTRHEVMRRETEQTQSDTFATQPVAPGVVAAPAATATFPVPATTAVAPLPVAAAAAPVVAAAAAAAAPLAAVATPPVASPVATVAAPAAAVPAAGALPAAAKVVPKVLSAPAVVSKVLSGKAVNITSQDVLSPSVQKKSSALSVLFFGLSVTAVLFSSAFLACLLQGHGQEEKHRLPDSTASPAASKAKNFPKPPGSPSALHERHIMAGLEGKDATAASADSRHSPETARPEDSCW